MSLTFTAILHWEEDVHVADYPELRTDISSGNA